MYLFLDVDGPNCAANLDHRLKPFPGRRKGFYADRGRQNMLNWVHHTTREAAAYSFPQRDDASRARQQGLTPTGYTRLARAGNWRLHTANSLGCTSPCITERWMANQGWVRDILLL